ncbi:unnamed protein product [Linum trigynum]|uniref:Uncharacterized protein n=1 Tax=Linum trigynum TaxID=586398 RepID=A0AAV2CW42_9ROSI
MVLFQPVRWSDGRGAGGGDGVSSSCRESLQNSVLDWVEGAWGGGRGEVSGRYSESMSKPTLLLMHFHLLYNLPRVLPRTSDLFLRLQFSLVQPSFDARDHELLAGRHVMRRTSSPTKFVAHHRPIRGSRNFYGGGCSGCSVVVFPAGGGVAGDAIERAFR